MFDQKLEYLYFYYKLILCVCGGGVFLSVFLQNIFTVFILQVMDKGCCCGSAEFFWLGWFGVGSVGNGGFFPFYLFIF